LGNFLAIRAGLDHSQAVNVVFEVITNWQGPGHSPKQSVTFFADDTTGGASGAAAEMHTLVDAIKSRFSTAYTATVSGTVKTLDTATGALTAVNAGADQAPVVGTSSGSVSADATQFLVRFNTGAVVNGRLLKGRWFVPGVTISAENGGNVESTFLGAFNTALASALSSTPGLVVWHRPSDSAPAGGSAHAVTSAQCWSEFAVLRRRRG
jgi:hypothetical protein